MKNWKVILAIVTVSGCFMSSGYTMLIPFLPMYLMQELGVEPEHVSMWSGAVFSITFFIGGVMAPFWGKLADSKGKRLMGIRSSLGLALAYTLAGLVTSPFQLFLVRGLQGFAAGLISVFMSVVGSIAPADKLGVSMGIFQSGVTCGQVLGPLIGGALSTWFGMRVPFFVAGTLLVLIALTFVFIIPEPNKTVKKEGAEKLVLKERKDVLEVLGYVALVQVVILTIQPIMSLYVRQLSQNGDKVVLLSGMIFSSVGIAAVFTAPLWGKLGQKKGFFFSMSLASILAGIMAIGCSIPRTLLSFGIMNFIYGLFFAGVQPALSATLASITPNHQQGQAFGYMFSAIQFGAMTGPLVGGMVAAMLPMHFVYIVAGCILITLSTVVFLRHGRKELTGR